jgi:hypothetical protein
MTSGSFQKECGQRFQNTENIQKKCDNGTGSSSTTGVPEMFPTVAVSLS